MSYKLLYQRKYLDKVLEEEEALIQDTRGKHTLNNILSYNLKTGTYNFASAWKEVKLTALSNCWKKVDVKQRP